MIEVLGMKGCTPCQEVKDTLDEANTPFEYYDSKIRGNPRTQELKKLFMGAGATKVPAIFVDGLFFGQGKDCIKELI